MLGEILENTRMLSSRIRKLEFETERSRLRDPIDMPLHMLREQAMDLAKAGMPIEMLIDRFEGRLPASMIKELISKRERNQLNE